MTYFFLEEKVSKKNFKFALLCLLDLRSPHGDERGAAA
mgnify:CR=1 FL=1